MNATLTPSTPPRVEVAVAILLRDDDREFLLGSRPHGKPYAGYWEFPGGKLEAGESVAQALQREMHEELGIQIDHQHVEIWRTTEHDYPHAQVRLHWCKVRLWQGNPQPQEGQQIAWQSLPPTVEPILPGAFPVLDALQHSTPQI